MSIDNYNENYFWVGTFNRINKIPVMPIKKTIILIQIILIKKIIAKVQNKVIEETARIFEFLGIPRPS